MSILTDSPSLNNLPLCLHCGTQVESISIHSGVVRCSECPVTFWSINDLERVRRDNAESESERDDDATLFEGQNYNWMREHGEWR